MDLERQRLRLYDIGYIFGLALTVVVTRHGLIVQLILASCAVPILLAILRPHLVPLRLHLWSVAVSSLLAPALVLGLRRPEALAEQGTDPAAALPVILLLTASRVAVALNDLRYRDFWARRDLSTGSVQRQSALAAVLLGIALSDVFQRAVEALRPTTPDPELGHHPVGGDWRHDHPCGDPSGSSSSSWHGLRMRRCCIWPTAPLRPGF